MNKLNFIKKYSLYLFRWQLSTIILAPCLYYLTDLGTVWATVIANLIGGCIFYFVDQWIFSQNATPVWGIKDNNTCDECKSYGRTYRLVTTKHYDKRNSPKIWLCENCSQEKTLIQREKGIIV